MNGYLFPCGKCNFCLQNRRNEWAFRLKEELKTSNTANFITLTYNDKNLPLRKLEYHSEATLEKIHLQKTIKHIRTSNDREIDRISKERELSSFQKKRFKETWKIKYYSTGEYGTKRHRPHYHIIIFNILPNVKDKIEAMEIWNKGTIQFGSVTDMSIQYVAKYLIDKDSKENYSNRQKPFALMSKGIGRNYLKKKRGTLRDNNSIVNHKEIK